MLQVLRLFLTVTLLSVLSIKSHPMDSDKSTSGDVRDLVPDKDVDSVSNTIRTIDAKLTEIMKDPPDDGGKNVMKLMKTYNEACRILLEHCKNDKYKAFPPAKDLLERGGPEFLDVDIDESEIEQRFSWDKEDVQNMHNLKKRTNILWYDLWRLYNNIPIDS